MRKRAKEAVVQVAVPVLIEVFGVVGLLVLVAYWIGA